MTIKTNQQSTGKKSMITPWQKLGCQQLSEDFAIFSLDQIDRITESFKNIASYN